MKSNYLMQDSGMSSNIHSFILRSKYEKSIREYNFYFRVLSGILRNFTKVGKNKKCNNANEGKQHLLWNLSDKLFI